MGLLEYAIYDRGGKNGSKRFGLNFKEIAVLIAEQASCIRVDHSLYGGSSTHRFVLEETVQKTWGKRSITDVTCFTRACDENGSDRSDPRGE